MEQLLLSREAKALYPIIIAAGELAISLQSNIGSKLQKSGRDFATEADLKVQQFILAELAVALPDIAVLGEEDSSPTIPSERFITVDPIDGTFIFAAGGDSWGILVSVIAEHQPRCGFIYQPLRQRMIYAEEGHGCYLNGRRLTFSGDQSLSESIIALAQGSWNSREELLAINVPLAPASLCTLCPASAVDAGFELLRGVCAIYLNQVGKIWDFAPLAIAVTEAGGLVSSPSGADLIWDSLSVPCLFTQSAALRDEVLAVLSAQQCNATH